MEATRSSTTKLTKAFINFNQGIDAFRNASAAIAQYTKLFAAQQSIGVIGVSVLGGSSLVSGSSEYSEVLVIVPVKVKVDS